MMRSPLRWAAAALTLMVAIIWWQARSSVRVEAGTPVPKRRDSTVSRTGRRQTADTSAYQDRISARIDVNPAAVVVDASEVSAAQACGIDSAAREPWERWVSLSGPRVQAKSSAEAVRVYAARTPSGVALLLANHGEKTAALQIGVRCGRGVYAIERHAFDLNGAPKSFRTERLQGVLLKASGAVNKPAWLAPKTAALLCVSDRARELGSALANARNALRLAAGPSPRAFRLVSGPFGEAVGKIAEIAAKGGAMPRDRMAQRAERAALSLAHAQTLFRNCRSSGTLRGETAEEIGEGLDRLEAALSEVTAATLDLVPNFEWAEQEPGENGRMPLSVQLSNRGSRALRMVKIGLLLPEECKSSPEDPAVFSAVRPGETVRATFMLQPASPQDLTAVRADLSYIAGRAPTHLRIKAN